MDLPFVVMAVNQDLVCRELERLMGFVSLSSKTPYVDLGLKDHAVGQQAIVAPPKLFFGNSCISGPCDNSTKGPGPSGDV